jgi:uncharacterized membrane protein
MDLYLIFLLLGIALIIIEVKMGFVSGFFLSGAISFSLLAILEYFNFLKDINNYLISGIASYFISLFLIIFFLKKGKKDEKHDIDINDY